MQPGLPAGRWSCAFSVSDAEGRPLPAALEVARRVISEAWPHADLTLDRPMARALVRSLPAPAGVAEQRRLSAAIQAEVRRSSGSDPWVGVAAGSSAPETILADSRRAISEARLLWSDPCAVLIDDLLAVMAIGSDREAAARLASLLTPLVRADKMANGPLLTALSTYIESGLSTTTAAARLGVHRHTLDQRLRKVEELLGRSIRRYPDRLLIECAVLAHRIVRRGQRS